MVNALAPELQGLLELDQSYRLAADAAGPQTRIPAAQKVVPLGASGLGTGWAASPINACQSQSDAVILLTEPPEKSQHIWRTRLSVSPRQCQRQTSSSSSGSAEQLQEVVRHAMQVDEECFIRNTLSSTHWHL